MRYYDTALSIKFTYVFLAVFACDFDFDYLNTIGMAGFCKPILARFRANCSSFRSALFCLRGGFFDGFITNGSKETG